MLASNLLSYPAFYLLEKQLTSSSLTDGRSWLARSVAAKGPHSLGGGEEKKLFKGTDRPTELESRHTAMGLGRPPLFPSPVQ